MDFEGHWLKCCVNVSIAHSMQLIKELQYLEKYLALTPSIHMER